MVSSKLLAKYKFLEEDREIALFGNYGKTGFPKPLKSYELVWEVYDLSLEEPYFWVIDSLKQTVPIIEKIEDSFSASENSAFFGVTQTRLGAQQDKVSQFLAATGKMIKELFQMIRELRILDERLTYYEGAEKEISKPIDKRGHSDEITLKGIFVDLVQGGGKSAASIYGMAQQLEFITLPDLFFDAPPFKDVPEMEKHVNDLAKNFNQNVLRVLMRHLRQYMEWKKRTYKEHESRKRFMLSYLKQHFEIIQMYIAWLKPYLRHVSKLNLKASNMSSVDMVSAFEGSMLDLEILARKHKAVVRYDEKLGEKIDGANGCVLITFRYRTRPELKVVQEGYQRGPVHLGKVEINFRVYTWTNEQLENYKKMKTEENIELMGDVSESTREAIESLGKELTHYLDESQAQAGIKKLESSEEKKSDKKSFWEKYLGDFYTPKKKKGKSGVGGKNFSSKRLKKEQEEMKAALNDVKRSAMSTGWETYKNFKKAHRMNQW